MLGELKANEIEKKMRLNYYLIKIKSNKSMLIKLSRK
jgi:hypothetical protein